jgi:hypothetical protein
VFGSQCDAGEAGLAVYRDGRGNMGGLSLSEVDPGRLLVLKILKMAPTFMGSRISSRERAALKRYCERRSARE